MIRDPWRAGARALRRGTTILLATALGAAPAAAQWNEGDLLVASWKSTIHRVEPANWSVTTFADSTDGLDGVSALVELESGALLASSYYNDTVFSFDSSGAATALWTATDGLSGPFGQNGLFATSRGAVYCANFDSQQILEFGGHGAPATVFADAADGVVHADGLDRDPCRRLFVANREGMNVLEILPDGTATVFDTLPDQPMAIALRPNGDLYVGCLYGDVWRYPGGDAGQRTKLLDFGRTLSTPVLRFSLDHSVLYFTSFGKGNLLVVDPDDGSYTEVLPAGALGTPLSIEVAGGHDDLGFLPHGSGTAGSGGFVPTLRASGHPVLLDTITFELRDGLGGARAALLIGPPSGDRPATGGASSSVSSPAMPVLTILPLRLQGATGVAGDGDLDVPIPVGDDPALDCVSFDLQMIGMDPAAAGGFSLSNLLRVTVRSD